MANLNIEVISTGNELLDGTISDTNTQRLALALKPLGLKVRRSNVIGDDPATIQAQLVQSAVRSDILFISGGLGPTSDDLTLEVAAKTFGRKLIYSKEAWANVVERLRRFHREPNDSQRKQAMIPEGAKVLKNDEGTAPGIEMEVGDCRLYFLPGVPREYDFLLQKFILPQLRLEAPREKEFLFIFKTFGWPESHLNELMKKLKVPAKVVVGYRTHLPENHLKLQVTAPSESDAKKIVRSLAKNLRLAFGAALFSEDSTTFEESILRRLLKSKVKVALAESCTGGLATSMLTKVSGSSKVVDRSFVTYSNEAKVEQLGVSPKTLDAFGAVSEQTVTEMARGALQHSNASRAVAISGIAGPTGGTKEKPVGLIWFAVASKRSKKVLTRKLQLGFDRELNQRYAAYQALQLLADS